MYYKFPYVIGVLCQIKERFVKSSQELKTPPMSEQPRSQSYEDYFSAPHQS